MRAKAKEQNEDEVTPLEESVPTLPSEKPSQHVVVRVNVKFLVTIAIVLVVAVGLYLAKGLFVVAVVNGTPITRFAVIQELEKRSGKQALDAMITKKIVSDELKKKGVTVSDEEISAETKKLEDQIVQQGGTLQAILDQQGMSREDLSEQIATQKKLEKLLGPSITVNDDEVESSIKDAKITVPEGDQGTALKVQVKEQLRQQKLGTAINTWIDGLKTAASITYLKKY